MTAHNVLTTRNLQAFALIATSLGLGLAACSPADTAEQDEPTDATERATTSTPGSSMRRYLSNHPKGCVRKPPSPWSARRLFYYPGVETPQGMEGYCLYEHDPHSTPTMAEVDALRTDVQAKIGAPLEEDTVVSGALGFEQDSRASLHDALLAHAGAMVDGLPLGPQPIDPVRIGFPDSTPEETSGAIVNGVMSHGSTLAWLAQDIANPPSNPPTPIKAGHITTAMALPQIDNDIECMLKGGFFGTRAQLAEAIYRVTAAWLHDGWTSATPQPRLVVNLSVGWEPTDGCAEVKDPSLLREPARAVFDAVSHASCLGGLVLAAAGNDPGHNEKEARAKGPTCPAAWTSNFKAPDVPQCVQLMGKGYADALPVKLPIPSQKKPAAGIDNPLLYAVGGIDFARHPIAMTREGGFPKYVAIASNASAAKPNTDLPPALTGTSVGTAVASAIAATTWAYRPELTAPELMDLVHDAGWPLGVAPDFGPNSQGEEVHSLLLCQALKKACAKTGGVMPPRCPTAGVKCAAPPKPENGPNPPLTPVQLSDLSLLFPDAMKSVKKADLDDLLKGVAPPNELYRSAAVPPWVYPQPFYPPCGACALEIKENFGDYHYRLYINVDPRFSGSLLLGDTTLLIRTGTSYKSSSVMTVGPLANVTLKARQSYSVDLGDVPNAAGLSANENVLNAQVSWKSISSKSTTITSFTENILVTH
jgi:Subtilase family